MKVQLLFTILCLLIGPIHCQLVNVDRENDQDSSEKKIAFSYNVSFASDKQRLNMLDLSNQIELDLFLKKGGKVTKGKTKPMKHELGLSNNVWNNPLTKDEKKSLKK